MTVKRALISVSDKTGLLELAHGLVELGVELIATSGTAAYLDEHGLESTRVEDLTGVAEMLGGRVKTLHPSVHGALLARRDDAGDQASLAEHGIEPIDLVIVNLYPFRHVAARRESSEGDVVEAIDIGGPAMVRAAAKNFAAVAVLVDPERYGFVLDELRESAGDLSLDTRRELAAEAFAHTAGYDIAIANWFSDTESFPERQLGELVKVTDLAYGENPHQRAAYYMEAGARRHLLSMVTQHGGKQLSFNNLLDLDAATRLVQEFTVPACVIVKHGNPCGCALAATPEEAYRKALAADPASAFGGVVAVNRPLSRELAALVAEQFVEVLHAPGYGEGAVDLLREKLRNLRLLESDERRRPTPGERDAHRVLGGMLIQDRDTESEDRDTMEVVAGAVPTEREWGDLLFAWRVVKHVRSNAIVIARDTATVGIGAGQMSRIDSTRLALGKALSPVAGRGARVRRLLPVRRRRAGRARRGRARDHRARRLEARRRGHRRGREGRRHARLHGPPPLLALATTAGPRSSTATIPAVREFPTILDLVGGTPIVRLPKLQPARRRARAREARVPEPGRLDQGSHRAAHDRGGRARRAAAARRHDRRADLGQHGRRPGPGRGAARLPLHLRDAGQDVAREDRAAARVRRRGRRLPDRGRARGSALVLLGLAAA